VRVALQSNISLPIGKLSTAVRTPGPSWATTNRAIHLWREKRGDVEPGDLFGKLIVQLGVVTEPLNRIWHERDPGTHCPAPGRFRRRTPGLPPFSSMNSTPADSNGRRMTLSVARRGWVPPPFQLSHCDDPHPSPIRKVLLAPIKESAAFARQISLALTIERRHVAAE
jgi:hypothetical protein